MSVPADWDGVFLYKVRGTMKGYEFDLITRSRRTKLHNYRINERARAYLVDGLSCADVGRVHNIGAARVSQCLHQWFLLHHPKNLRSLSHVLSSLSHIKYSPRRQSTGKIIPT